MPDRELPGEWRSFGAGRNYFFIKEHHHLQIVIYRKKTGVLILSLYNLSLPMSYKWVWHVGKCPCISQYACDGLVSFSHSPLDLLKN